MSNNSKGELAQVFAALGDGVRLQLIGRLLAAGAMSATALAGGEAISRQAIVKHLQVLESAGLVTHSRQGREVLYALDAKRLQEARDYLDAVSRHWDASLARLRNLVEP
ncbi:helix-turn-helix transcriptional regulator [Massilia sp. 9I]|uniref:ArsR/SmtB family transcription factor n=1 Tax=Massilia sp. 9I TaxID=2653152 RepID=UPI0012F28681|nr:metalloregulator ArsR/SmtB family transcription factor [Massilia sp. 9I]VXB53040.1 Transcriptional regulator [Massilia sp. 9I]